MSLQIPIQKDIGEYEEKIVGKLSFRTPSVFTPHERPEAPLREPSGKASGAHRARSAEPQGEEDVQTQRSGGQ